MKWDISRRVATQSRFARTLVPLAMVAVMGACNFIGGGEAPTPTPTVMRIPPTPTTILNNTPAFTPTPTPTSTPAPNLTSAKVEQLVFLEVRSCADQLSSALGSQVRVEITTSYSVEGKRWMSEAISKDKTFTFGLWQVLDATEEVTPLDPVASAIISPDTTCAEPVARLATGGSPPWFLAIAPSPTPPTPTPAPAINTKEEAELRVWVNVYSCYAEFPELASFTGHQYDQGHWVVEGKSQNARYGLWQVDSITGEIAPLDQLAHEAAVVCNLRSEASFPSALTGEQAELLVWTAVYDCFTPRPLRTSFTFYADNPQRWLVEGREEQVQVGEVRVENVAGERTEIFTEQSAETVYYGFWMVDSTTAAITAWDQLARETEAKDCYKTP